MAIQQIPVVTGPTLAQIDNSVATNAPSANAWTVISSVTPTGTSTVFSSLSGYKKYRIVYFSTNTTESSLTLRINGDTGNNYAHSYWGGATSNNYIKSDVNTTDSINIVGASLNGRWGILEFENASLGTYKLVTIRQGARAGNNTHNEGIGVWRSTSAITSITMNESISYTGGNITLLGAN